MTEPAVGVSVIVPTLAAARAEGVTRSLASQTVAHEVIMVDNGSADGDRIARLRDAHPALDVVRFETNRGYSRAVNEGARVAECDVLVFVNDDCQLDPTFLEELTLALDPRNGVVMAAGILRDARAPALIDTAGIEIDSTLMAFDYLNGEPIAALGAAPPPLGPSAGAAAIERDAFREVGGFDEGLFAYVEDVDLTLRLRLAGARCALARRAMGTHAYSTTFGAGSARKNYLMGYGRGYVLRKWSVTTPRRLPGVVLREAAFCVGQAVVDGNLAGARGRVKGFRAARERHPFPTAVVRVGPRRGGLAMIRRRARRRLRLWRHRRGR